MVWQTAQSTIVPWGVEVDAHGEARTVELAIAAYQPTDPQIAWHLARFIEQVRRPPSDAIVVRQNWLLAYESTTDRGAVALNDYARSNDPFTRVNREQISIEVSSVSEPCPIVSALPMPPSTAGRVRPRVCHSPRLTSNSRPSFTVALLDTLPETMPDKLLYRFLLSRSRAQIRMSLPAV